jgi:hypothetical protein
VYANDSNSSLSDVSGVDLQPARASNMAADNNKYFIAE